MNPLVPFVLQIKTQGDNLRGADNQQGRLKMTGERSEISVAELEKVLTDRRNAFLEHYDNDSVWAIDMVTNMIEQGSKIQLNTGWSREEFNRQFPIPSETTRQPQE